MDADVMTTGSPTPARRDALTLLAVAAFVFSSAALTIHYTTIGGRTLATIWPSNAMILAIMLVRPAVPVRPLLLTSYVAVVLANFVTRGVMPAAFGLAAMNIIETYVAATLMRPHADGRSVLRAPGGAWPFILVCGAVAPALGAAGASLIAAASFGQPLARAYTSWLFSHSLGLLLFTPVVASVARGDYLRAARATDLRAGLAMAALLAFTSLVAVWVFRFAHLPVLFVPFVPIMLITFRVGRIGAELSVLIVALIGATCTINGYGPVAAFVHGTQPQLHFLQIYLATLLLTAMPVAAELSARRALTWRLAQSERAVKMLAAHSADALLAFDRQGICRDAAGAAERLFSRPPGKLVGEPATALATADCTHRIEAAMAAARDDPGMTAICEFRSAAASHLWLEASLAAAEDGGVVATIRDATERREREAALTRLARVDALTGALNRAGFLEALDELARADPDRPYALAAIDIDHFKGINDGRGHAAGDAALQQLAHILAAGVRRGDAVGRIGGDEFMIALRATEIETATALLARLAETVDGTVFTIPGGGTMRLSISCGIARHAPGTPSETTRGAADEALYEAKRAGRNQVAVAA